MKLTLQIKLLPNKSQIDSLKKTMYYYNLACNDISEIAFSKKIFNQFKLHKQSYYFIKNKFNLSSQLVIRSISKVSDSYKNDKKTLHKFKQFSGIAYDSRVLSYFNNEISISTIDGRLKIPFFCYRKDLMSFIKGEGDLVFKNNKFYIYQTIDLINQEPLSTSDFIGVDFGQTDIAVLSDGTKFSSEKIKSVRKKYSKVRASVQSKGTKGSKKLLKRLSGREHRFISINNHTISKSIVAKAKNEKKGIALEDLTGIRKTAKTKSKKHKTELNRWAFYQLRSFIEYKAKLSGVKVFAIPPAYTSKTCSNCFYIGDRNGKYFKCNKCGNKSDADINAAKNISSWGVAVNTPEKSNMACLLHSY